MSLIFSQFHFTYSRTHCCLQPTNLSAISDNIVTYSQQPQQRSFCTGKPSIKHQKHSAPPLLQCSCCFGLPIRESVSKPLFVFLCAHAQTPSCSKNSEKTLRERKIMLKFAPYNYRKSCARLLWNIIKTM